MGEGRGMSEEKKYTPAEDYKGLLRQFSAMQTLLICKEKEISYYDKKDYNLSERKLKELEENLESEKNMNHELTTRESELLTTIEELKKEVKAANKGAERNMKLAKLNIKKELGCLATIEELRAALKEIVKEHELYAPAERKLHEIAKQALEKTKDTK